MKKIVVVFIIAVFFNLDAKQTKKKSSNSSNNFISAEYAVLIDGETEDVLFEMELDERCAPSSMTKLMTLYILFSEISKGRIKLDDEFPVSKIAQKMKGSRSFFQSGKLAKVEDLIRSIIVHSGNDACVVVAEGISGDVDIFAKEMNEKAKEFGLKNTNFVNPTGMPDENHFSSVHDLSIIAARIISGFPQFYHYFSEKVFTINSITQRNRNTLLGNSMKVDGLKTGKTDSGGYGIVVSAKSNEKRLIAVINGCKSAKNREHDANKLLDFGFRNFSSFKIAEAGNPISKISVLFGVKKVKICTHEDVIVTIPKKYKELLKIEAHVQRPIEAPVVLGKKLGSLSYKYKNFTSKNYDLFAVEPVEKIGFFERAKLSLKHLIFGDDKEVVESRIDIEVPSN